MPESNEFDKKIINELKTIDISGLDTQIINPWHTPFMYISWGIVLVMIRFNFWNFDVIFPSLGCVLLLLGTRILKKENKFFKLSWVVSIILMIDNLMIIVSSGLSNNTVIYITSFFDMTLKIVLFMSLRSAIRVIDKNAVLKLWSDPFVWSSVLVALIAVLSCITTELVVVPIVFLIIFAILIRTIYKLNRYLNEKGYPIKDAEIKVNAKLILICYTLIFVSCFLFTNHPQLNYNPYEQKTDAVQSRVELSANGVPENVVDCLSDDEVNLLNNNYHVTVSENKLYFEQLPKKIKDVLSADSTNVKFFSDETKCIDTTRTILIDNDNTMYVIDYFELGENLNAFWGDSLCFWCSEDIGSVIGGGLFYTQDGISYKYNIDNSVALDQTYNFMDMMQSVKKTVNVSYPLKSEKRYGYIVYKVYLKNTTINGCCSLDWYHRNYPVGYSNNVNYSFISGNDVTYMQNYSNFNTDKLKGLPY